MSSESYIYRDSNNQWRVVFRGALQLWKLSERDIAARMLTELQSGARQPLGA